MIRSRNFTSNIVLTRRKNKFVWLCGAVSLVSSCSSEDDDYTVNRDEDIISLESDLLGWKVEASDTHLVDPFITFLSRESGDHVMITLNEKGGVKRITIMDPVNNYHQDEKKYWLEKGLNNKGPVGLSGVVIEVSEKEGKAKGSVREK